MVALTTRDEMKALAVKAGLELEGASALEILTWADEQFGTSWAVASSMADAVLPSLAAQVRPGVFLLYAARNFERIGDQATNIAERVHFAVRGRLPEEERPR